MLNRSSNLNKPHNSVITYTLCYVYVKKLIMNKDSKKNGTEQCTIPSVSGSSFKEMEQLQKELKEAEIKYVWGKDIHEQNKANLDMMTTLNKIRKLKGIE